jgi:hypothetical protein
MISNWGLAMGARHMAFAGDSFVCGPKTMAEIHCKAYNELKQLLPEWCDQLVQQGLHYDFLKSHIMFIWGPVEPRERDDAARHLVNTVRQQIQRVIQEAGGRYTQLMGVQYWEYVYEWSVEVGVRNIRAKSILHKLLELEILGMDLHSFDHMARWLQGNHGWSTTIKWICLEDFSWDGRPEHCVSLAYWMRFGLEEPAPERRTGAPGLDHNILEPSQEALQQELTQRKVVLIKDLHIRVVPLSATCKGHCTEPQPARKKPGRGRRPRYPHAWDFVNGQWCPVFSQEHPVITMPDGQPAYEGLRTTEEMWLFAVNTDSHHDEVDREHIHITPNLMWGFASKLELHAPE